MCALYGLSIDHLYWVWLQYFLEEESFKLWCLILGAFVIMAKPSYGVIGSYNSHFPFFHGCLLSLVDHPLQEFVLL